MAYITLQKQKKEKAKNQSIKAEIRFVVGSGRVVYRIYGGLYNCKKPQKKNQKTPHAPALLRGPGACSFYITAAKSEKNAILTLDVGGNNVNNDDVLWCVKCGDTCECDWR